MRFTRPSAHTSITTAMGIMTITTNLSEASKTRSSDGSSPGLRYEYMGSTDVPIDQARKSVASSTR